VAPGGKNILSTAIDSGGGHITLDVKSTFGDDPALALWNTFVLFNYAPAVFDVFEPWVDNRDDVLRNCPYLIDLPKQPQVMAKYVELFGDKTKLATKLYTLFKPVHEAAANQRDYKYAALNFADLDGKARVEFRRILTQKEMNELDSEIVTILKLAEAAIAVAATDKIVLANADKMALVTYSAQTKKYAGPQAISDLAAFVADVTVAKA